MSSRVIKLVYIKALPREMESMLHAMKEEREQCNILGWEEDNLQGCECESECECDPRPEEECLEFGVVPLQMTSGQTALGMEDAWRIIEKLKEQLEEAKKRLETWAWHYASK